MQMIFMVIGFIMASSTSFGMQVGKIVRIEKLLYTRPMEQISWLYMYRECNVFYTIEDSKGNRWSKTATAVSRAPIWLNEKSDAEMIIEKLQRQMENWMKDEVPVSVPLNDTEFPVALPLFMGPEKE